MSRIRSGDASTARVAPGLAKRGLAESPLGQLRKARAAKGAATRAKYARAGLAQSPQDAETRWLLMRQLYISHLEQGALESALDVATQMTSVFVEVQDVARFDVARVHLAAQDWQAAKEQLTAGEHAAPASRKWDHLFTRARLEAVLGHPDVALSLVEGAAHAQPASQSVVRLSKDPVLHAAKIVWRAQSGARQRRDTLSRAYAHLSEAPTLPVLGEFFAGRLLWLLSHGDARSVLEGFLRATTRLPAVARFGLAPEVFCARQWLGKPLHLT